MDAVNHETQFIWCGKLIALSWWWKDLEATINIYIYKNHWKWINIQDAWIAWTHTYITYIWHWQLHGVSGEEMPWRALLNNALSHCAAKLGSLKSPNGSLLRPSQSPKTVFTEGPWNPLDTHGTYQQRINLSDSNTKYGRISSMAQEHALFNSW